MHEVQVLFVFHHGKVRPRVEIPMDCFCALIFHLAAGVPTARSEIACAAAACCFGRARADEFLDAWASLDAVTTRKAVGW